MRKSAGGAEERLISATRPAKLGVCGEESKTCAVRSKTCALRSKTCEVRSKTYAVRRARHVRLEEQDMCGEESKTCAVRRARHVRREATTDRGHHWWHAKSSKRLLEPRLWQEQQDTANLGYVVRCHN